MAGRFADRVAVVTGSGAGLGRLLARRLAAEGAAVVVADRDGPAAERVAGEVVAAGGRALACVTDVTQGASVAEMARSALDAFGPVDLLINNAAWTTDEDPLERSEEGWDGEVAVTLKGPFLCARAVLPGMIEGGRGVILNVGSVNGHTFLGNEAYSAAKAGLVSLTRSLAVRYGSAGVRVNLVAPGTLRTAAWDERLRHDPGVLDSLARWYPLGRVGTPEDVVGPALFLCSDEASWITGAVLPVDGGLLAGNAPMAREILGEAEPA